MFTWHWLSVVQFQWDSVLRPNNWVTLVFCVLLLLLTVIFVTFRRKLFLVCRALFSQRHFSLVQREGKLSKALDLADDQKEAVADIHHTFASELMFAAQYSNNDRKVLLARAIDNDVKWMRYVLNEKQMRTYLMLLNITMNNRGLSE